MEGRGGWRGRCTIRVRLGLQAPIHLNRPHCATAAWSLWDTGFTGSDPESGIGLDETDGILPGDDLIKFSLDEGRRVGPSPTYHYL